MYKNPWRTKSSRVAYENAWIRVHEDQVIRPDGNPGIYGVVKLRPSACVLALNERDEAVLVGQWRYTLGRYSWELPRGGSHESETDMLAVAKRELAEEAGIAAFEWEYAGTLDSGNGVCDDVQHFYIARGLSNTERNPDPEEDITIKWLPFHDVLHMALEGNITEVCSVALILRAALLRKQN